MDESRINSASVFITLYCYYLLFIKLHRYAHKLSRIQMKEVISHVPFFRSRSSIIMALIVKMFPMLAKVATDEIVRNLKNSAQSWSFL